MEEEDGFLPNLASMLEVSLVEDSNGMRSEDEEREPTEICGEAKSNVISVNRVAPSDAESHAEAKVTDVPCHPVGEQNEVHSGLQELLPSGKEAEEEEKQLFYSLFKDTKMVMYLRLHCTVCDCHIGCTPVAAFTMAFHKYLRVLICKDCETFYGIGDFVCADDGSETFCSWCGQGGHLYCCSICPSVFCKKCIRRNLGMKAVKMIAVSNDWTCYRCNLHPLREHRALCWGLSTFLKEQSKDEKKVPEDEAEKSPGFNPLVCCQGEKPPYYRASQPLRPIIFPSRRQTQNVKDIKTLTLQTNETNILLNTLISGGKFTFTTPATVTKTNSETASIRVNTTSSSTRPVGVVTSQIPSTGKQFMPVKSPTLKDVSHAAAKLSARKTTVEPNATNRDTTLYVLQKQSQSTYENAFLSHLAKTGVQSGTFCRNQTPGQNTAVTVTSHVNDSTAANLETSIPSTYIRSPLRPVPLSPTPNSSAGPRANKVLFNKNNNSGGVIYTMSPLHMAVAQRLQRNAVTLVPTTYCTITSDDPPKLVPLHRFSKTSVPASGSDRFTSPPRPKNVVSENAIKSKTATSSVNDDNNDDDIVEVFNNVLDSNAQKVEFKWMMETFRQMNCTSRVFLYHADILRQKFEKESTAKGISHIIGKCYCLLKKLLKRLNVQKEYVSKEFSVWLNAEKAKHGIPTTEGGQNSSPGKDKGSESEITQEPELLLDMDITCESDHEDVSDPITEVQQNLIWCNENLSDNDSDSDDPFSDCESNKQEKVMPVLKPILSQTVGEVLRDKCTRKLLLQLLTEHDSKTENSRSKMISSTEGIQSIDGKEEPSVKKKEYKISKLKTHVYTDFLTQQTSANCDDVSFSAPENVPCSGAEKEKCVKTETIDSNGKDVRGTQMGTSTSGTEGKAGNEESESCKSPCKSSMAKSVDANCEVVQDSQMETSSSGTEGKAGNEESESCLSPCKSSVGESVDADCEIVQDSQMETSSSGTEGIAGNEESESCLSPCKSSVGESVDADCEIVQDSQMETSSSGTEGKTMNAKCDNSNQKCQATKRKYRCVSHTVMSSDMETKRFRPRRSVVMVPGKLQRTAIPVKPTDFTALVSSAVQKNLIKPCSVSVVKLNRTN